jgi:hypothetical protein
MIKGRRLEPDAATSYTSTIWQPTTNMRSLSLAALVSIAAITPSRADQDVLLTAVSFALTGYDTAHVEVVDRSDCIFVINGKRINGHLVGEVFHLNNVDVDRITIEDWHNAFSTWIEVHLRGESTIYEYTGDYENDKLKQIFQPRQSSSWLLKIYSNEKDRLIRAWQYVYANGCTGKKSPF